MRRLSVALGLLACMPAAAQHNSRAFSAELGGTGAAATVNVEVPIGAGFSARAGLGTLPPAGVTAALPVGVRYAADAGPVAVEAGVGALVASLSSEYLFTWMTDIPSPPALQLFPTAEAGVRFGVGGGRFVRVGMGAFYDRYDPAAPVKLMPAVGFGVGW
jgi:hypothetical protein